MQEQDPQFDDPVLRDVVRRAFAGETAPVSLRQRVVETLDTEQRAEQNPRRQWNRLGLAAAAVLVIGVGLAYLVLLRNSEKPVPQWFAAAMVASHDQCAGRSDHHLLSGLTPANDVRAAGARLWRDLGYPVLAAELGDGWTFAGAGICQVSGHNAAHLLYTRGQDSISVFSIPAAVLYAGDATDGTEYSQVEQGHPVSGFIQGGAVHCLVGRSASGSLTLQEVKRLRDQVRRHFSPAVSSAAIGGACGSI